MGDIDGLPWYPRYMGDYARKTKHLSLLEHGAYNLLLDHYYSTGESLQCFSNASSNAQLMPDHSRLYRICGAINKAEQEAVDNVIEMFFHMTKDGYINKKASEVLEKQHLAHKKRVDAGRKGGKQSSSNAKAKPKEPEPEPEPTINTTIRDKILKITKWDESPNWFGNWSRLNTWLESNFDVELDILPTIERLAKYRESKNLSMPTNLKYFEQAISDAYQTRITPIEKGKVINNGGKVGKRGKLAREAEELLEEIGRS